MTYIVTVTALTRFVSPDLVSCLYKFPWSLAPARSRLLTFRHLFVEGLLFLALRSHSHTCRRFYSKHVTTSLRHPLFLERRSSRHSAHLYTGAAALGTSLPENSLNASLNGSPHLVAVFTDPRWPSLQQQASRPTSLLTTVSSLSGYRIQRFSLHDSLSGKEGEGNRGVTIVV